MIKREDPMNDMDENMKKTIWKRPHDNEIRSKLTPLQYKVTQKDGTEPPFQNEYWDNKKEGIYVDIVSGEPLFSSKDKYKSGTGWPSFWEPISDDAIVLNADKTYGMVRVEVLDSLSGSHLGHVFEDGRSDHDCLKVEFLDDFDGPDLVHQLG